MLVIDIICAILGLICFILLIRNEYVYKIQLKILCNTELYDYLPSYHYMVLNIFLPLTVKYWIKYCKKKAIKKERILFRIKR